MTDLLHFWCSFLIVLVQQVHLNYSENVAEVDLSLTQMSQIMIKLDQFLSTKYKIENKMPKTEEEKIANLKELQLESIRHFFDFDNENEFMPIILYNLVESLPKLGKSAANSPNFDLNTELAQLTLEQNLLVLEGLFDFGWFNGSKLVYGQKELLKTKAGAKWRLIDWHFYEELEKKFWQVRNIIRRLLSNDMRSTLFQKWNPTQIKLFSVLHSKMNLSVLRPTNISWVLVHLRADAVFIRPEDYTKPVECLNSAHLGSFADHLMEKPCASDINGNNNNNNVLFVFLVPLQLCRFGVCRVRLRLGVSCTLSWELPVDLEEEEEGCATPESIPPGYWFPPLEMGVSLSLGVVELCGAAQRAGCCPASLSL
uniref:SH3 domain-containing protein n=1 Tax=Globodera pallida TaxID=36090 RepID=A0A183BPQ3_GLOPA